MKKIDENDKWISVKNKDDLPAEAEDVILVDKDGYVFFGYYLKIGDEIRWRKEGKDGKDVTYNNIKFWQPRPLPPSEDKLNN